MKQHSDSFRVSELYSNQEIYQALTVGNAGGVRMKANASGDVERLVIFSSAPTARQLVENPYHDRLEGDVLIYTGAGREGNQSISGINARIVQQQDSPFPIYGFVQLASRRDKSTGNKRWAFLGLLEYLRGYRERQVDAQGNWRNVWVFELRIHPSPSKIQKSSDHKVMRELLASHRVETYLDDREVVTAGATAAAPLDISSLEPIRRRLLMFEPRQFEHVLHDLLVQSGFENVEVTKYSQDGGIDVNARGGKRAWPIRQLLVQIQAKRWLHTVGRKEVAELRGSLQPHAAGCLVTTSHFSRAAIGESMAPGKVPITVIDGYELASIITTLDLRLP